MEGTKTCPLCAETIQLEALVCHYRQFDLRTGKPTDNCFIESFNGSLRDECLNIHWFESMEEARAKI